MSNKMIHSPKVLSNHTHHFGRFTVVHLQGDKSEAVGIARRSSRDKDDPTKGESIARGRAEKALFCKETGKPIRNAMMG